MHHTVLGTIPKSNIKIVERGETDAPCTQIHDRSLACLGTDRQAYGVDLDQKLGIDEH
jgi:hypothetical protein